MVVVIAVILVVAAIVLTNGGALPALLGDALGWIIGEIGGMMSSFMAGTIGVEIGGSVAAGIGFGIMYAASGAISSIADHYAQTGDDKKKKSGKKKAVICPPSGTALVTSAFVLSQLYKTLLKAEKNMHRNEEGGWIYTNKDGALKVVQKDRSVDWHKGDGPTSIHLGNPREIPGYKVVGTFHSHGHGIGATPGRDGDFGVNNQMKVPGIIVKRSPITGEFDPQIYGPDKGVFGEGVPNECR